MSDLMKTPAQCIEGMKNELMKNDKMKQPDWSKFVKTGANAERPPSQKDWWYMRSAAILRRIYLNGPVGVQRLRTVFGGKRRRGHKPPHRKDAGGKVIRTILQQLENSGYITKTEKPKKGRIVTKKGQALVDRCAK